MIWKVDFGVKNIVANNKKINTEGPILILDVKINEKEYIFLNLYNVNVGKGFKQLTNSFPYLWYKP